MVLCHVFIKQGWRQIIPIKQPVQGKHYPRNFEMTYIKKDGSKNKCKGSKTSKSNGHNSTNKSATKIGQKHVDDLTEQELLQLAFNDNKKKIEKLEQTISQLSNELCSKTRGTKSKPVKLEDTSPAHI